MKPTRKMMSLIGTTLPQVDETTTIHSQNTTIRIKAKNESPDIFAKKSNFTRIFMLIFFVVTAWGGVSGQTAADYTFTYSSGTYTQITGTTSTATGDDGYQTGISIGFTFNYCGANYTTFNVATNGVIYFAGTSTARYSNDLSSNSTTNITTIAPLWDDLFDDATSNVQYSTTGTAGSRILTVQWKSIRWNAASGGVQNFQVKLYETSNKIEFIYGTMSAPANSPSASIGIIDATGGSGHFTSVTPAATPTTSTTVANNSISSITNLTSGLTFTFTPPAACVSPTTQPTALSFSSVTSTGLSGTFTAASPAPSGYLVVRSTSSSLSSNPVDATTYSAGNSLGGGTVVQSSASTNFTESSLSSNTTYYYFIFSYNNTSCSGGPKYLTTSPLQNSVKTCPGTPTSPSTSLVTTNGFTLGWTAPTGGATDYTVDISLSNFGASIAGYPQTTASTSIAVSGLNPSTIYYYKIKANNSSCSSAFTSVGNVTTSCSNVSLTYSQGFNAASIPSCWTDQNVSGSGTISYPTNGSNPSVSPQEGSNMVMFNSYSCASGAQRRLCTPPITTTGTSSVDVEFQWYTSTSTGGDGMYVEYSTDGTTWATVGSMIPRLGASNAWGLKTVTLPSGAGNQPTLYVGFRFYSAFGYNCYMDAVVVKPTPANLSATSLPTFGNVCTSTTAGPNSFTLTGSNLSGNVTVNALAGFTYCTTAGGSYTNTLTLTPSSGSINQAVYVKFAPSAVQSYNGNINVSGGGATAIDVAASGTGISGAAAITAQPGNQLVTAGTGTATFTVTATGGISYQWEESADNGATWSSLSNSGIYSGVTTASLVITNPAIGKNGCKYRCAVTGCSANTTSNGNATLTVTLSYCTPAPLANSNGITRVIFNTIDNATSGTNGYQNYTSTLSTTVMTSVSYNLSVYANTGGAFNSKQRAWIDWNQDGDFTDSGEQYDLGQTYNVSNGLSPSCPLPITVPANATIGTTRLRISSASGTYYADPCENGYKDEFEDYTIIVQPSPILSASPLADFGNVITTNTAGPNSFNITGQYLTSSDVTVGPLTGYTFCTTSGGTYSPSLSIPQAGGTFSQTIYVKFSPTAVQSYDGNIPVGGGGAPAINVPVTGAGIAAMTFVSCTTTQSNTNAVPRFTTNAEIIGIQVVTNGTLNPLVASYFSFTTNGSTNAIVDIGTANLFYTGNSKTFAATNQFGSTKMQPNGRFSFTGTQTLSADTNYFWLAYDIPLTATLGNLVDAQCDTVTVSTVRTPATTNPAGNRVIGNIINMNDNPETVCYANFYDNGGATGNYSDGASFSKTFIPDAGKVMKIVFSSFNTSESGDSLTIYDGSSNSDPVIGKYYGSNSPGTVIATNTGELTVSFKSNSMNNSTGWSALVTCEQLPPNCATLNMPADLATNQATNTSITWLASVPDATHNPATTYKLYFGTDAAATNIQNGTNIGNVTSWGMMLDTSTTYYWKIVPVNACGEATGCNVIRSFTTANTHTVTTYNVPTDYPTIKAAYSACTGALPYIINVTTGYAGETYPITLNNDIPAVVNNRSAANPIIIRPSATFSYTFLGAANKVFEFSDGAKYITIDGRQGGTGSSNAFVFTNTSASTPVISFTGDNSYNTLRYCKIKGNNMSSGIIVLTNPTNLGIRYITIDNNEITKNTGTPSDGIVTEGTNALKNCKIAITNNKIYDIYADVAYPIHGIYFGSNGFNYDCTVTGNSVYLTSTVTPTSNNVKWHGILVKGNNHVVTNNFVGGTAPSCGGTALTIAGTKENQMHGISVEGTLASSTTNVEFNTVNNISLSSTHRSFDNMTGRSSGSGDQTFVGITITEGGAKVNSNTIGGSTAGSITVINANTTNPATINDGTNWGYSAELVGIMYNTKTGTINNTNNTIQGLWCYPSSTATTNLNVRIIGIYAYTDNASNSGYTHKIQNNTIGGIGGLKAGNNTASDAFIYGILAANGRGTIYIKNNTISNLWVNATGDYGYLRGIHNNGGIRAEIENNTISNLTCAANNTFGANGDHRNRAIVGLMCDNDGGDCDYFFLIKNTVYDLRSTATSAKLNMIGIYYRHNIAPVYGRVYGNKVYSINAVSSDLSSKLIGIWAYGQNTITYNNMISLGSNVSAADGASCPNAPANTGGYELIGIENNYGKNEYYYNTVNIVGTSGVGASNSYAYKYVNSGTEVLSRVFRNNIFSNTRSSTSGTAKHYAFSVSLNEAYGKFTSDYNYFYVSGTNGILFDDFGTDRTSIADWTASSGKDTHSTGTGVISPADPLFVAPNTCSCNLDITDIASPIAGSGSTVGVPTFILDDFNSNSRSTVNNAGAVVLGASTLPIELITFSAKKVDNQTQLEWITATETNNDHFTIERSLNGIHFEPVSRVKGAGNSTETIRYEAFDPHPINGINYYRLKQTDYNGGYSYSNTVAVNFSENTYVADIYPNPFNQHLNVNISGITAEKVNIQVMDLTGKTVFNQWINNTDHGFGIDFDSNLPNGIYFMKVQVDAAIQTYKIVKCMN